MDTWKEFISSEAKKDYYEKLISFVQQDSKTFIIYPAHKDIFNAFKLTPLEQVKVVILGQDPYHNPNQAHGLSFSVPEDCEIPPSLRNIFKEIKEDLKLETEFNHGFLKSWAEQGVLLLNSVLTVRQNQPGSHKEFGWQTFTDNAISKLNDLERPVVFMLWGSFAKSKKKLVTNSKHLILETVHPSPLSAYNGFFGCKHFSKANQFLINNNITPIDWSI